MSVKKYTCVGSVVRLRQLDMEKEVFNAFCKTKYGLVEGGPGGCTRSKTISLAKGKMIINVLKGDPVSLSYSCQFRHWVKHRGFKLISHQALGLKDVLCLPAKNKVFLV